MCAGVSRWSMKEPALPRQQSAIQDSIGLRARIAMRRALNRWRSLPRFLIIGAQRSGTTSLHRYLAEHPDLAAPIRKEIHYFTTRYPAGPGWYRAHFPLDLGGRSTFESTPYYLFHPLAATRASMALPDARLIAVLRNPVDRAYSQYQLNVSLGRETLSFEAALIAEPERMAKAFETATGDPAPGHGWYSYAARGDYAAQLDRWLSYYPRENLFLDTAERLFATPARVLSEIEAFLGIREWQPESFDNWSRTAANREAMSSEAREMLEGSLRPSYDAVAELLGRDPGWS